MSQRITKNEIEKLREKILVHEWEAIPLIFFHAALGALLDRSRNQRLHARPYDVNDEIDICRIAIALHSGAYMMITEKSMSSVVKQFEKDFGEKLNVFGMNERAAIEAHLEMALAV